MTKSIRKSKAEFENIQPTFGSSFYIKQFNQQLQNKTPVWHFHPEIELVCVNNGSGRRHVGQHLSYFANGDLLLLGSNLPHFGFTDRLTGNAAETIIQMKPDFLGDTFFSIPEMRPIQLLFERAKMGIVFTGKTKDELSPEIHQLIDYDPRSRLIHLLSILNQLAVSPEYTLLNSKGIALEVGAQDSDRMNKVFDFVRENFQHPIPLEQIADLASMTEPSFCRFFKKKSGKHFTQFVNEYRLVHASKLLSEGSTSISEICLMSGFNNFSYFNKSFKRFTGKSPSAYRNEFKRVIS